MILCRTPQRVFRVVALLAPLALVVLPTVAFAPAAVAMTAAGSVGTASPVTQSVAVFLDRITPTVAVPRVPITISGTLRNTGSVPVTAPVTRASVGRDALTSREAVTRWATSTEEEPMAEVARSASGPNIAPGAVVAFSLTVPAGATSHRDSFAVLPLLIEVVGTTADATQTLGRLHSFLPTLSSVKAYEPVSIAWLVPLTLDPDPALHGLVSRARTDAWMRSIGSGSRLDRVIAGTENANVTWAIDPAILGAGQPSAQDAPSVPGPTPGATPPQPGAVANTDQESEATTALASRLRAAASRHTIWSLPYADPDLTALLPVAPASSILRTLITRPNALAASIGPVNTGLAWPVDGSLTTQREQQLRRVFSSSLSAAVTSASNWTSGAYSPDASRKSSGGLPLLSYDEALSRTFAQTSSTATGALTIQRFLADSMALLGERPGTPNRSVLVAAPRMFAGDPAVLGPFFAAVANAPWLVPTTTDQVLAASRAALPETTGVGTTVRPPTKGASLPDPLSPGPSPLTSAGIEAMSSTMAAITGIASIRDDSSLVQQRWTDAQQQLLSVRWRGHPRQFAAVDAASKASIASVSRGVRVAPSSVNFFADRGVLQIIVVNDLSVPVHDVRLSLAPGQPRLRFEEQPGPLKIGARSRANVKVRVSAVAAGLVPIEAVLTTPNGTLLGERARVNVRVQPPSTWIYWALGALIAMIFVLGLLRSLRRGPTRVSRPTQAKIRVHD
jgi:hypothetical protein